MRARDPESGSQSGRDAEVATAEGIGMNSSWLYVMEFLPGATSKIGVSCDGHRNHLELVTLPTRERIAKGHGCIRCIGIVVLARRLLIALWQ
jgi:hypothetical protein